MCEVPRVGKAGIGIQLYVMSHEVTHNEARRRFEWEEGGHTAHLDYVRREDRILLVHTEVPEALAGRGLGGTLAKAALDYARANELAVVPKCPFVASYLVRHPEYQDLVRPEDRVYLID